MAESFAALLRKAEAFFWTLTDGYSATVQSLQPVTGASGKTASSKAVLEAAWKLETTSISPAFRRCRGAPSWNAGCLRGSSRH